MYKMHKRDALSNYLLYYKTLIEEQFSLVHNCFLVLMTDQTTTTI